MPKCQCYLSMLSVGGGCMGTKIDRSLLQIHTPPSSACRCSEGLIWRMHPWSPGSSGFCGDSATDRKLPCCPTLTPGCLAEAPTPGKSVSSIKVDPVHLEMTQSGWFPLRKECKTTKRKHLCPESRSMGRHTRGQLGSEREGNVFT